LNFLEKPEIKFLLLEALDASFYCHVMMVQKTKAKARKQQKKQQQ